VRTRRRCAASAAAAGSSGRPGAALHGVVALHAVQK